jgi:hypothetical protein
MSRSFALDHHFRTHRRCASLFLSLAAAALFLAAAAGARAQFGATSSPETPVHDPAALRPPAGARVAIVEFADMECPDCARANPLLNEAAARYHIPLVRHDFPLPFHAWSFEAAVDARWFDTHSKALGDEYRDQVFANQTSIYNPGVLRQFTTKFAAAHHIAMPFAIDPQGKLGGHGQLQGRALCRGRRSQPALPNHRSGHRRIPFALALSRKAKRRIPLQGCAVWLLGTVPLAL